MKRNQPRDYDRHIKRSVIVSIAASQRAIREPGVMSL
jgi:hypothetical protein